jgi:hypothetical protein
LFSLLRSLRWWLMSYGSVRIFGPVGTPGCAFWLFALGVAAGAYYVFEYVPCP